MTKEEPGAKSELPTLLEGLAAVLLLVHLVLRLVTTSSTAGAGVNLLIHSLVWIAAAIWLLAKALAGGFTLRLTGLEIPFLLWIILCLVSLLQASHKLPAIEHAFAFASLPVLFWSVVHLLGPERRGAAIHLLLGAGFAISCYALLQVFWLHPYERDIPIPAQGLDPAAMRELEIRREGAEAFGTFVYPNSFAGFLVLLLPILAGALLDTWRRTAEPVLLLLQGLGLAAGAFALYLTGSLGGWTAFLAAAAAFAGLAFARKSERARKVLYRGAGALALLVAALVALGPLSPANLGERNRSMWVRNIYWEAGAKIVAERPIFGVGLDNFQDHYPKHKSDLQHETRRAHNDYLQILAEMGVPGLLVFLAILLLMGRAAFFPKGEGPPPAERWRPGAHVAAAAIALGPIFAYFLAGVFNDVRFKPEEPTPILAVIVIAIWYLYHLPGIRPQETAAEGPMEFLRLGAAAGFAGICVHMLVDFDFYDFGVATALFFAAGIFVPLQRRTLDVPVGPVAAGISALVILAVLTPILGGLAPSFLQAEAAAHQARKALEENDLQRALAEAQKGMDATALHDELLVIQSDIFMRVWRLMAQQAGNDAAAQERALVYAMEAKGVLDNLAKHVRPDYPLVHFLRAQTCIEIWLRHRDAGGRLGVQADGYLAEATISVAEAVKRYPTKAEYHFARGFLHDARGDAERALTDYRRALELSALALRDRPDPGMRSRLELDPYEEAHAAKKVGRGSDAAEAMAIHLRRLVIENADAKKRKFTPQEVRSLLEAMSKKPRDFIHPWYDPALDDVLGAAIDRVVLDAEKAGAPKDR